LINTPGIDLFGTFTIRIQMHGIIRGGFMIMEDKRITKVKTKWKIIKIITMGY